MLILFVAALAPHSSARRKTADMSFSAITTVGNNAKIVFEILIGENVCNFGYNAKFIITPQGLQAMLVS